MDAASNQDLSHSLLVAYAFVWSKHVHVARCHTLDKFG